MALLAEYQARLIPIIQNHGGSIDKFLGDGRDCDVRGRPAITGLRGGRDRRA